VESTEHALRDCSWARKAWFLSPLGVRFLDVENGSMAQRMESLILNAPSDVVDLAAYVAYGIWMSRNSLCFEQNVISLEDMLNRATKSLHDYKLFNLTLATSTGNNAGQVTNWVPPINGNHKLNVDVASPMDNLLGIGAVVRDQHGMV